MTQVQIAVSILNILSTHRNQWGRPAAKVPLIADCPEHPASLLLASQHLLGNQRYLHPMTL